MTKRKLVPGTVRYKSEGRYVWTSPTTSGYSTALMIAEEYYDGRKWVPYVPGLNNLSTTEERSHVHKVRHRKAGGNKGR